MQTEHAAMMKRLEEQDQEIDNLHLIVENLTQVRPAPLNTTRCLPTWSSPYLKKFGEKWHIC